MLISEAPHLHSPISMDALYGAHMKKGVKTQEKKVTSQPKQLKKNF